jgi:NitT/TauT family transport system permease protein
MNPQRMRSILRGTLALLLAAAAYQAAAQSGLFPKALLPGLPKVAGTLADMLADGSMLRHAATTLARMLAGFALRSASGYRSAS